MVTFLDCDEASNFKNSLLNFGQNNRYIVSFFANSVRCTQGHVCILKIMFTISCDKEHVMNPLKYIIQRNCFKGSHLMSVVLHVHNWKTPHLKTKMPFVELLLASRPWISASSDASFTQHIRKIIWSLVAPSPHKIMKYIMTVMTTTLMAMAITMMII